jgi:hypothetical protein
VATGPPGRKAALRPALVMPTLFKAENGPETHQNTPVGAMACPRPQTLRAAPRRPRPRWATGNTTRADAPPARSRPARNRVRRRRKRRGVATPRLDPLSLACRSGRLVAQSVAHTAPSLQPQRACIRPNANMRWEYRVSDTQALEPSTPWLVGTRSSEHHATCGERGTSGSARGQDATSTVAVGWPATSRTGRWPHLSDWWATPWRIYHGRRHPRRSIVPRVRVDKPPRVREDHSASQAS